MSIRLRLAAWYAGSVLLLFLVTGLLLRFALHETLEREHLLGAERSAEVAHGVFRAELAESRTTEEAVLHMARELVIPDQSIDFIDPAGQVYATTVAPGPRRPSLEPPVHELMRPLDPDLAPGWTVRVSASLAPFRQSLRRIDRSLIFIIPLSMLLAALAGWWLSGRTLRPVGVMAAAAERISPSNPDARIPVADPRDELGRLAIQFNKLLERLAHALSQQRQFLADAAHELRTPVARMLSQTEVALGAGADDGERERSLRLIQSDLERTRALVGELLHLARVDAGEPPPPLAPGYLDDVVASAVQPWRTIAAGRGIELEVTELDEAPALINPELIERLTGILLDNALRYTPEGGRVTVHVGQQSGAATLEVTDTGIGIPTEERGRVFERFFRGSGARGRAPEGSGLGLPIALWIVRQHRGSIELTAPPAGGTRIRVTLPAAATS